MQLCYFGGCCGIIDLKMSYFFVYCSAGDIFFSPLVLGNSLVLLRIFYLKYVWINKLSVTVYSLKCRDKSVYLSLDANGCQKDFFSFLAVVNLQYWDIPYYHAWNQWKICIIEEEELLPSYTFLVAVGGVSQNSTSVLILVKERRNFHYM